MHPHPDTGHECTPKPGGWQDEMKHKRHLPRKPVRVPGLPSEPTYVAPRPLAHHQRATAAQGGRALGGQRELGQWLAAAHHQPGSWRAADHTLRSQILEVRVALAVWWRALVHCARRLRARGPNQSLS